MNPTAVDRQKEALRQQLLLRVLLHDTRSAVVAGWLLGPPQRVQRGIQAYQANAGASAQRALAAAFPTLAMLIGSDATAGLARAYWHAEPPRCGDLACWGDGLPAFIEADAQLAGEPYLADVARLDWAVHQAERAADAAEPAGLHLLASAEPAALQLQMVAGTAVVSSPHPIVTIWQAHRPGSDAAAGDRFAAVRAAFASGRGEHALVARGGGDGLAGVFELAGADAAFTAALLAGRSLGEALSDALAEPLADPPDQAGPAFEFEPWLIDQLQHRRIAAVTHRDPS